MNKGIDILLESNLSEETILSIISITEEAINEISDELANKLMMRRAENASKSNTIYDPDYSKADKKLDSSALHYYRRAKRHKNTNPNNLYQKTFIRHGKNVDAWNRDIFKSRDTEDKMGASGQLLHKVGKGVAKNRKLYNNFVDKNKTANVVGSKAEVNPNLQNWANKSQEEATKAYNELAKSSFKSSNEIQRSMDFEDSFNPKKPKLKRIK